MSLYSSIHRFPFLLHFVLSHDIFGSSISGTRQLINYDSIMSNNLAEYRSSAESTETAGFRRVIPNRVENPEFFPERDWNNSSLLFYDLLPATPANITICNLFRPSFFSSKLAHYTSTVAFFNCFSHIYHFFWLEWWLLIVTSYDRSETRKQWYRSKYATQIGTYRTFAL